MSRAGRGVLPDGDPGYAAFLAGKSIVAVGPARTLVGKKLGSFIDSFDLVVRFNEAFDHLPSAHADADDIGTRADVFYCNQVILRTHVVDLGAAARDRFASVCDRLDVKYLVCTNNSMSFTRSGDPGPECPRADRRVLTDLSDILATAGLRTRTRVVHAASHVLHRWLDGNWGRTGFVALFDLMTFHARRLHATGMTFYHGGGHLFAPGVELHPLKNRDGSWAASPAGPGHDSYLERDAMRWLVRCFPRSLTVDDDVKKLLGYPAQSDRAQPNGAPRAGS